MDETTLFVGDLHLQQKLILPFIEQTIDKYGVKHVVFLGDYVDQWNCTENGQLYINALTELNEFKNKCNNKNIKTTFLLGNHDIPYLNNIGEYYSINKNPYFSNVAKLILELNPQIAYMQSDDNIASHAGYVGWSKAREWELKPWNYGNIEESIQLQQKIGRSRGGYFTYGSQLWADLHELQTDPSPVYQVQIVGHTPVKSVTQITNDETTIFAIDTFSLDSQYNILGDGSVLLYQDNNFKIIKNPEWQSYDMAVNQLELLK